MKFLKIFLSLVVILILILAVGLVILWQTFDIARYKPQITQQISKAIGRDAAISDIKLDLSFSKGATVSINRLTVADSKDFNSGSFLEIDSVDLNVDIRRFIMKKEIKLTKIEVNGPRVNLIRLKDGRLNVPVPPPSEEPADLSRLSIDIIRIKNGEITFTDRSSEPPLSVPVDHLDLDITDFAFDRFVNFSAKWGIYSPEANFDTSGSFRVDQFFKDIRLENFKLNSRLSAISLEDFKKGAGSIPFVEHLKRLQGDIAISIPSLASGASGLKKFTAEADVKNFVLDTPDIPVPLNNINGQIRLTPVDLELNGWSLPLASGMVHLTGRVEDYWIMRRLSADVKANDLDIYELLNIIPGLVLPDGIGLAGKLRADLSVAGSAMNPDPDAILDSLTAKGTVAADQGVVQGFNLMQDFMTRLDKLSQILGVGIQNEILAKLPEEYKNRLALKDTPIRKLEMVFNVQDQKINFGKIDLGLEEGSFTASGSIDMAQNLSVAPEIFVSPELTNVFVRAVEDLEDLVGSDGRLSIPLIPYNGPAAKVSCPPDTSYLIKKLGTARIKKELKGVVTDTLGLPSDFVGAVLGGRKTNSVETDSENSQTSSNALQKETIKSKQDSTPGQLIGGVLDKILGQ